MDNETARTIQNVNNRRKYPRYDYPSALEYCLAAQPSLTNRAFILDISASGLCLHLYQRLSIGQQIEVKKTILPVVCKTARICWICETLDGGYTAGFDFLSSQI